MRLSRLFATSALTGAAFFGIGATQSVHAASSFIGGFDDITTVSSTVPSSNFSLPGDGDVNPYGVAVVPDSIGHLLKGNVLISNFNNSQNQQGTGTTIVEISPSGHQQIFARVPELFGGTGLTTSLAVLPGGFVIVGSLPTSDGTSATAGAGALILLDDVGHVVTTFTGGNINGPWDLTAIPKGRDATVFFTNVLNGTVAENGNVVNQGTVVRMDIDLDGSFPRVLSSTVIGSGFAERTDPTALVVGPTGLGLNSSGTLYVADTVNSAIQSIPNAINRTSDDGTGSTVASGSPLNGPLGLAVAPNGDILTVNGLDGNILDISPSGAVLKTLLLDNTGTPPNQGAGALFGLATVPGGSGVYFVDDNANTLMLLKH